MTKTKVVKKRKKKKLSPIFKLVCIGLLVASGYLFYLSAKELYMTYTLSASLEEAKAQLQEVTDENTYLTSQRDKLEDPEYVQSYARGNYLLTKDGENIYYLPSSEK